VLTVERRRVLIVEDDQHTRDLLVLLFEAAQYDVVAVADGASAVDASLRFRPDVALLDSGLPGMDGREVARRLRERSDLGIIFVTGADTAEDVRSGFDAGGDDYVTKPFDNDELLLRVRAILRRSPAGPGLTRIGELVIDEGAGRVTHRGDAVPLTPTELKLLAVLVRARGRVVPKSLLLADVWGYGYDDHLVEVHVNRLRAKLARVDLHPIRSVRGMGYIFEPKATEPDGS